MKVKIAILDSGIDINHEYLSESVIDGISFKKEKDKYKIIREFQDENGHGTACASVIKKECPQAEFFIVKVLDKNAESNLMILEEALDYLKNTDIRLINMSLSIIDKGITKNLKKICDELNRDNRILVCSLANGYKKSYPAAFKSVIGVRGFILEDEKEYWFNKNKRIQAVVDYNEYLHCNMNNRYSLFGCCNSFASAKMTGIIGRIMTENPYIDKNEIYKKLENDCSRKRWHEINLRMRKRFPEFEVMSVLKYNDILNKLENTLVEFFNIKDSSILYKKTLYNEGIGVDSLNCYDVLKRIEKDFDIKFKDYTTICIDDFCSIYTLAAIIIEELKRSKVESYE